MTCGKGILEAISICIPIRKEEYFEMEGFCHRIFLGEVLIPRINALVEGHFLV